MINKEVTFLRNKLENLAIDQILDSAKLKLDISDLRVEDVSLLLNVVENLQRGFHVSNVSVGLGFEEDAGGELNVKLMGLCLSDGVLSDDEGIVVEATADENLDDQIELLQVLVFDEALLLAEPEGLLACLEGVHELAIVDEESVEKEVDSDDVDGQAGTGPEPE